MHDHRRERVRGRRLPYLVLAIFIGFAGWTFAIDHSAATSSKVSSKALGPAARPNAYGSMPLSFEENRGQTDPQVRFLSRGNGYALFLTSTDAVLKLRAPTSVAHQPPPANSRQPITSN